MRPRDTHATVALVRDGIELARWPLALPSPPGLDLVDELAHLQLAARRHGCSIALRGGCPELSALIELVGLSEVIAPPADPRDH